MKIIIKAKTILLLLVLFILLFPAPIVHAQADEITPDDLIYLTNTIRTANGLPALRVDPILMVTAQATADRMATENLTWHIGNTAQRIQDAGYGGTAKVWATENFAMSWGPYTLAQIQQEWADDTHMIPMRKAAYCNIGAGVAAAADGTVYYIVHAAYTSAATCASYQSPTGTSPQVDVAETNEVLTVDPENTLPYTVASGDSLWSIAIAHDTSIAVIKQLNNLTSDGIYVGQNLKLPAPPPAEPIPTQTPTLPPRPTSTLQASASPTPVAITTSPTAPQPSPTPTSTPTTLAAIVSMNTPAPPSKNPALLWQIISGLEFAALAASVVFFWKPWKLHHRVPEA